MSEPDDRTPPWALPVLFFLLFALVLGMVWIRVRPKAGAIEVEVRGHAENIEIFVDGSKACDASPCLVEDLSPGEHEIRALSAEGGAVGESIFVAAGKKARLTLTLEPALPIYRPSPGNVVIAPVPPAEEEPVPTPVQPPTPEPDTAPTVDPIPLTEAISQSTLNLNSIPPASVMIDGKALGQTPKMGVLVTPGKHLVSFVHPQLGTKIVSVAVDPGETKTVTVKLF